MLEFAPGACHLQTYTHTSDTQQTNYDQNTSILFFISSHRFFLYFLIGFNWTNNSQLRTIHDVFFFRFFFHAVAVCIPPLATSLSNCLLFCQVIFVALARKSIGSPNRVRMHHKFHMTYGLHRSNSIFEIFCRVVHVLQF